MARPSHLQQAPSSVAKAFKPVSRTTSRITNTVKSINISTVAASTLAALVISNPAMAFDLQATEATFTMKCAGCHAGGGNVLAVGATLFQADLEKNGLAETQGLYNIIYKGKGKMPGFGKECAPKGQCTFGPRFTDEQVSDMAEYVLQKAAAGWK